MKILYVEDEPAHFELTQRTLDDNLPGRFVLYHVDSLKEALNILESESNIDLVLTDLRLPDGSGLDLLRRVKDLQPAPAVVLVTGQGDEQVAVTALKSGAMDYLVKEGDYLRRLPAALTNAVAQNKLVREQAALRAAEHRFKILVEQVPAAVYTDNYDENSSALYISPQIEAISGYSASEWLADPLFWLQRIHPHDLESVRREIKRTYDTLADFNMDYRLIHRDGHVVWLRDSAKIVLDAKGNPKYWQGILFDITYEVEAQATLRASEERFRRIFHSTPIATSVITLKDGRFLDANFAFQSLVGVSLDSLIGHTPVELGFWQNAQHWSDFLENFREQGSLKGVEFQFTNAPTGPRDTLAFFELIELSGMACLLAMFYDVTDQKKAQKALQTERDFALQVLNNMGQGLTVVDKDSNFEYVNPAYASMLGYSVEEFTGKKPDNFTTAANQITLEEERARRKQGIKSTYESKLLHKDGHEVPVTITGVPRQYNGEITGAIAVITDQTLQKQTEQALERQVKELTLLHAVATTGAESLSEDEVIEKVTKITSQIYTEMCGILLLDPTGHLLIPHPSYFGAHITNWAEGFPITTGVTGRAIREGKFIRTGNISQEPDYIAVESGMQSELCVPIQVHENIIGVLNVESRKAEAFDEKDERLLITIAGGLGTAIERMRLFKAQDTQLQREAALLKLMRAAASSLDLKQVLQIILDQLVMLIPAQAGSIQLLDKDHLNIVAVLGTESEQISKLGRISLSDFPVNQFVITEKHPLRIDDVRLDKHFINLTEDRRTKSFLAIPLIVKDQAIGLITLDSFLIEGFSEQDEELGFAIANHAGIAIENARLYEETQRRLREMETINQVSTQLRMAQSIEEILPILLDEALALVDTQNGAIWLYNHNTNELTQRLARGAAAQVRYPRLKPEDGIVGHVFSSGEKYTSPDIKKDQLLYEGNRDSLPDGLSGLFIPIKSMIGPVGVLSALIPTGRQIAGEINLLTTLAEITGNAIHRAELFEQSQEQIHRLTTLRDIDSAIASSTDLRVTLNILMDQALKHLHADAVDILLYHHELQSLSFFASAGFYNLSSARSLMRLDDGLAGQVVMKGGIEQILDLQQSDEVRRDPMLIREGFVAYFGVPLIVKGQIKGVFEIFIRSAFTPTPDWMQFLQTLAGQAAIAIDNTQLFDNLQRSNQEITQAYDTTLEGWARALELRDRETEGHTRRVTDLTMQLARYMGIPDDELVNIYRGVLLHDIGKMGVPDQILRKTGPLNDSEWIEMRKHPEYAFNLLSPIPYLRPALDVPYCHHEHWDGSGYPRRLKGEQIPLAARIFAIVDIWDALLSDRPYRKAWPEEKVVKYLRDISGTTLDPEVVRAFLNMLKKDNRQRDD